LYGVVLGWYLYARSTQKFVGPFSDPLRLFGIIAFVLVLMTAGYALRRRFVRGLPGKVQSWLWMHTWVGVTTILIALLHENFAYITHSFCQNTSCFTSAYGGFSALLALIVLVVSGIVGRLVDKTQTNIIAREAAANGLTLEERIQELEYTIERFSAGKSETFKQYCWQAIGAGTSFVMQPNAGVAIASGERLDFMQACTAMEERARLLASLQRQQAAQRRIRIWRTVHITIATLSLLIISYHAIMELLSSVLRIL
jgi:hypothetical protein